MYAFGEGGCLHQRGGEKKAYANIWCTNGLAKVIRLRGSDWGSHDCAGMVHEGSMSTLLSAKVLMAKRCCIVFVVVKFCKFKFLLWAHFPDTINSVGFKLTKLLSNLLDFISVHLVHYI